MEKLIHSHDQEELVRAVGMMSTLIESDRHIKSAASDSMSRQMLADCKPDADHFLVHLVAMGDYEKFGFNRNGDAFTKKANALYHPTFVSNGHFFREHRNRDAKTQGIGLIKASCHNAPMGRTELAIWGHKKKAEDVYDLVKAGKATSYSMSCRVKNDRSSITNKLARNPSEYDEYTKYRMGQWIPEHNKFAFVYNDEPNFFDISYVKNPADRIAHHLEYVMDKAASASAPLLNGVELARLAGVSLPQSEDFGCIDPQRQARMLKLASCEEYLDALAAGTAATDAQAAFCKFAGRQAFTGQLNDTQLQAFRGLQPGTFFRKLAKRNILLPFESFAAYTLNKPIATIDSEPYVKEANVLLPQLFRKLATTQVCPDLENACDAGSEFMSMADLAANDPVDKLMDDAGDQFSAEPAKVKQRVLNITVDLTGAENPKVDDIKQASVTVSPEASTLAQAYAFYKLAALETIESIHSSDTSDALHLLAAIQNRK